MQTIHVIYRSVARFEEFDDSDIAILRSSILANGKQGVTGLLVRVDEQFFQALHGPAAAVDALLERIAADDRHSRMQVLLREEVPAQSPYGQWSMAYDSLIGFEHGLSLLPDGSYPEVTPEQLSDLVQAMAKLARGVADYGSAFPYSRKQGESDQAYLDRLES